MGAVAEGRAWNCRTVPSYNPPRHWGGPGRGHEKVPRRSSARGLLGVTANRELSTINYSLRPEIHGSKDPPLQLGTRCGNVFIGRGVQFDICAWKLPDRRYLILPKKLVGFRQAIFSLQESEHLGTARSSHCYREFIERWSVLGEPEHAGGSGE